MKDIAAGQGLRKHLQEEQAGKEDKGKQRGAYEFAP